MPPRPENMYTLPANAVEAEPTRGCGELVTGIKVSTEE